MLNYSSWAQLGLGPVSLGDCLYASLELFHVSVSACCIPSQAASQHSLVDQTSVVSIMQFINYFVAAKECQSVGEMCVTVFTDLAVPNAGQTHSPTYGNQLLECAKQTKKREQCIHMA